MAEFQGSFLSFITSDPKQGKSYRNPVPEPKPQPEIIDLEEDSESEFETEVVQITQNDDQGEEQIIETGLYEVVEEQDIEAPEEAQSEVMASVKKVIESREEIYRRLESELKQLTQACQDDFLFQITNQEYDDLFKHKAAYLNELNQQVRRWCSKNLQLYRVCSECGYKVIFAKEIREHMKGSTTCSVFYHALGTSAFPANTEQCRECNYSSNLMSNMRRHQMAKGHKGIDRLTNTGQFAELDENQQAEAKQNVPENKEEEVQEVTIEPEQVPAASSSAGQNDFMNDISMWPKDDDSGGIISNLQARLEQQVENSDDHFIFRISNEEYTALIERRAYHMAKFGELVNIYCNKTLKLYQVCDGCGFATFLRNDMIKHFETGSCILSYFNALGTCDDDDPNKDAVEEESEHLAPIENQFEITEVEATPIEIEPTEVEPTEIEPAGVDRYLQPKLPKTEVNFQCPHCNNEMCIRNKHRHLKHHCPILLGKSSTEKHPIPLNKKCPQCTRSFQTTIRLNHHIRIVHSEKNRKQLKCETCHRPFKYYNHLKNHTLKGCSVPKEKEKPAAKKKAEVMVRPSSSSNSTEKHFNAVPIQCKDCMIFFVSTVDLFRHQKNYCKAHQMRTAPLESVIKVEPTSLGGGLGQG